MTSAAVSVPVTVPALSGQCCGVGTPAGGVPLVHRNSATPPLSAGRPKWMCACVESLGRSLKVSVYEMIVSSLLTLATKVPVPVELMVAVVSLYPDKVVGKVNLSANAGAAARLIASTRKAVDILLLVIIVRSFPKSVGEAIANGGGSSPYD